MTTTEADEQYTCTITRISPQHATAIHKQISPILGYDTWTIGTEQRRVGRPSGQEIDLVLNFRNEGDFPRVMDVIRAIVHKGRCNDD
jgi:hypothetical protein